MEQGTRNTAKGFRSLVAWSKADALAHEVFRALRRFPADDRWLARQATRAAVSVPANIAEGYSRGSLGDYLRFVDIARGSLGELEYYLGFLTHENLIDTTTADRLNALHQDAGRLLHGLWTSLKQKARDGTWDHGTAAREEPFAYVADDGDTA
jgi:four helix bundle protein